MKNLEYVIQPGDTLSAIAGQFGTTVSGLLAANPQLTDPALIFASQSLSIPTALTYKANAFICPYCLAYAHQDWRELAYIRRFHDYTQIIPQIPELEVAVCDYCHQYTIWRSGLMIYPAAPQAESVEMNLELEARRNYQEAKTIMDHSPRMAVALLRLCLQGVCEQLDEKSDNLHKNFTRLVRRGLPPKLLAELRRLRVFGKEAIDLSKLDKKEDRETAMSLLKVIDLIVEIMIACPRRVNDLHRTSP